LPYSSTSVNLGTTLFEIGNGGTGSAATFRNAVNSTALEVQGNITFFDGAQREFGILQNVSADGDALRIFSGDAGGTANNGGDLLLQSGAGAGTGGAGGNIQLNPGAGASGPNGGVFINGVTRFGNPAGNAIIELEDGSSNAISIAANGTTTPYTITLPGAQGTGALTNNGAGALS
jgi:hypothetical protein